MRDATKVETETLIARMLNCHVALYLKQRYYWELQSRGINVNATLQLRREQTGETPR